MSGDDLADELRYLLRDQFCRGDSNVEILKLVRAMATEISALHEEIDAVAFEEESDDD